MPAANFKTTVVVFEIKPFHTGTNQKTHKEYTIWQVRARRHDTGQEIDQYALRSFDKLPLNEPIEVEAQLYDGGNYGLSYTLKPLQKRSSASNLGGRVEALEQQVAALYKHLNLTPPAAPQPPPQEAPQQQSAAPPTGSPPPPPAGPPVPISAPPQPQPVPPTQVGTSNVQPEPPGGYGTHNQFGGDEDIPF